jgi:hypothetical protein
LTFSSKTSLSLSFVRRNSLDFEQFLDKNVVKRQYLPTLLSMNTKQKAIKLFKKNQGLLRTADDKLGDKSAAESVWLLMTKNVLQGSRSKSYSQQKNIVAQLAETTGVLYQVPTTLEAATCILAEYSRSENRLFSDNPWTYTSCQENVQGRQKF